VKETGVAICSTGKVIYRSRKAAKLALRHLQRARKGYSGDVYPCPRCKAWHIGRGQKQRDRQNKERP